MTNLPPRLRAIVDLVPAGSSVADIGTDHALVPMALAKDSEKCIKRLIATEIAAGPLKCAERNLRLEGLAHVVELRMGQGFDPLAPGEADTVIIAGMGFATVCDILDRDLQRAFPASLAAKNLLIQANGRSGNMRRWLISRGFDLVKQKPVEDKGRFYLIDAVAPKGDHGPDDYITSLDSLTDLGVSRDIIWDLGPLALIERDPVMKDMLAFERRLCKSILADIGASMGNRAADAAHATKTRLGELEMIDRWL